MFRSRHLPQVTLTTVLLAASIVAAWALLTIALDPFKATIAVLGLAAVLLGMVSPVVGLWINIFANTSLQVLGSAHITGAPTSLSKLFAAVSLAAILLHLVFANWKLTASPIYRAMILYTLPVLLWDFFPSHPEIATMEGTTRFVQMMMLCWIIGTIGGQGQKTLDQAVIAIFCAIALCGVIGSAEHFLPSLALESDDPKVSEGSLGAVIDRELLDGVVLKRISGGIGDANWLAYTIAIVLPLLVYCWQRWPGFWPRTFFLGLAGLQMIALVFSYTRTGFLGLGVAGLYLIVRGVVPLRPLLATLAAGVMVATVAMPVGFADRMFSSSYLKEGSTPLRTFFVTEAAAIWRENPLLGSGFKSFGPQFYESILTRLPDDPRLEAWAQDTISSVRDGRELVTNIGAHNLALELLVEYGIVGTLLYTLIMVVVWREATRLEKTGPPHLRVLAICIKAALVAFMVCGFLGHNKYLKIIWIMVGLLIAARRVGALGESGARSLLASGRST